MVRDWSTKKSRDRSEVFSRIDSKIKAKIFSSYFRNIKSSKMTFQNHEEIAYLELCKRIIETGNEKGLNKK